MGREAHLLFAKVNMVSITSSHRRTIIMAARQENDVLYKTASTVVWSSLGIVPLVSMSFEKSNYTNYSTPPSMKNQLTQELKRKWRKLFRKFYADALKRCQHDVSVRGDKYILRRRPVVTDTEIKMGAIQIAGENFMVADIMPISAAREKFAPRTVLHARKQFVQAYVEYILVYDLFMQMKKGAPKFKKK